MPVQIYMILFSFLQYGCGMKVEIKEFETQIINENGAKMYFGTFVLEALENNSISYKALHVCRQEQNFDITDSYFYKAPDEVFNKTISINLEEIPQNEYSGMILKTICIPSLKKYQKKRNKE